MDSSVRLELLDGELSVAIVIAVKVMTLTLAVTLTSFHNHVRIVLSQAHLMKRCCV